MLSHSHISTHTLAGDPRRWCTVRIGQQKRKLHIPVAKTNWEATFSFLVYNLQQDAVSERERERVSE